MNVNKTMAGIGLGGLGGNTGYDYFVKSLASYLTNDPHWMMSEDVQKWFATALGVGTGLLVAWIHERYFKKEGEVK